VKIENKIPVELDSWIYSKGVQVLAYVGESCCDPSAVGIIPWDLLAQNAVNVHKLPDGTIDREGREDLEVLVNSLEGVVEKIREALDYEG